MPDVVGLWTEPIVRWATEVDSVAQRQWMAGAGTLVDAWPAAPFERAPTECFKVDNHYWIWQVGVGGITFSAEPPDISAHPALEVEPQWFDQLLHRFWLPAIYPLWGRQVLHATAVASIDGDVAAFTGPTQAGKSTLAYGMGTRAGWRLICDDTLAFSILDQHAGRSVALHPLKHEARLRPATAEYYGWSGFTRVPVEWPDTPLSVRAIYVLDGRDDHATTHEMSALKAGVAYPLLLEQAHTLTLQLPAVTQRLMRDYLELTARVPVFRFTFQKGFGVLEDVFRFVEAHFREVSAKREATPSDKLVAG